MAIDMLGSLPGFGDAADRLLRNNFDPGVLRPWLGQDGRSYVTKMVRNARGQMTPKAFVTNAPATLTRDAWIQFDSVIIRAVRERLRLVADIRAAGLVYNLPNGMSHTVLAYQTVGDGTPATISMDPIRRSETDLPHVDEAFLPLPIIHKDWDLTARQIAVSRQGNVPLDTTLAEQAGRAVAEEIEKLAVGSVSYSYSGATIYGLINHPDRYTKTNMTVPDGTNGPTVLGDILTLRQALVNTNHFGPYIFYVNSQWAQYLDTDFSAAKGDQTLRQRILAVEGITDVRTLDYLPSTNFACVLVQMSSESIRVVVGMEVTTLQWESQSGLQRHFKTMAMVIPQIRPDTAGEAGLAHGTTA